MGSNGGTLSVEAARKQPIRMIESGPAAGALAAAAYARRIRLPCSQLRLGGTTAKVCLIDDAAPLMAPTSRPHERSDRSPEAASRSAFPSSIRLR